MVVAISVTSSFAMAPYVKTYVALEGELVDVTPMVTVTVQGFDIAKQSGSPQGNSSTVAQTLAVGAGGDAHTTRTKGNWIYSVRVDTLSGVTPPDTTYSITLKKDAVVVATLYVASDATPSTGEYATAQFDLGSTMPASATYVVEVQHA